MPIIDRKPLAAYYKLPPAAPSGDDLLQRTFFSAAEVMGAFAAPLTIIDRGDVGKIRIPTFMIAFLRVHGDPYAADHEWKYGIGTDPGLTEPEHFYTPAMDASVSSVAFTVPTPVIATNLDADASPWSIWPTSAFTGGTSTLEVWAYYREIAAAA